MEVVRFDSQHFIPDGNCMQVHVREGTACFLVGWERELTRACEPIPVVEWLALARVVLRADGIGRAAWGTHWRQSCGESRTAGMKELFILQCPCFLQNEKPSYQSC